MEAVANVDVSRPRANERTYYIYECAVGDFSVEFGQVEIVHDVG